MDTITRKTKQTPLVPREQLPVKPKPWKLLSRRRDKDATENTNLRRFCKRVRTVFMGRSEHASAEGREVSQKTRLLRPLKRVWKNTVGKGREERSSAKQSSQDVHDLDGYTRLPSSSSIAATEAVERGIVAACESTDSRSSSVTYTEPTLRPPSIASGLTLVDPIPIPPEAIGGHLRIDGWLSYTTPVSQVSLPRRNETDKESLLPKRHTSQDVIVVGDESATVPDTSSRSTRNSILPHNGTALPRSPVAREQYHPPTPTSDSASTASVGISSSTSEEADYQRLMRVFFRAPATRIPIPAAWRCASARAFSFRGPTSPFRKVSTAPVAGTAKEVVAAMPVFATEPRRPAHSHAVSLIPIPTATLQNIASRHASPECVATQESNSHPIPKKHTAIPTLPQYSTLAPPKYVKTVPLGWSPGIASANREAAMREAGMDEEEILRQSLGDKGEASVTETHTDVDDSVTVMSGDDVWFDASEGVVDGPLH